MNAPGFPTSSRDTETKGGVEMASVSSCCVRAAGSFKRELKQNQKKSVPLCQCYSTLYNFHLKRETCIPGSFPPRYAQQFFWKKNKMEKTSLSWPPLFAVSCRTPLPRLFQQNVLCQNTFASYHSLTLSSQITTGYTSGNYVTIK
jgi:hypothetical protein